MFEVLVIGAGFAGLSAAVKLVKAGVKVAIIEKRAFFGGRAYSFVEAKTKEQIDNGQHLLLGAYHETFGFLKDLGTLDCLDFKRSLRLFFRQANKKVFELACPFLPAPFHVLGGLLKFNGISLADKIRMGVFLKEGLKKQAHDLDNLSVQELLVKTSQSAQSIAFFWEPLCLATLNETPETANAALFFEVLRRGLLTRVTDSRLVFPKVGLSELYADPAEDFLNRHKVPIYLNRSVLKIEHRKKSWAVLLENDEQIEGQSLIVAIPPPALQKMIKTSEPTFDRLTLDPKCLASSPIVSINFWIEDFDLDQPMIGFLDSPLQWVFSRRRLFGATRSSSITAVVSAAKDRIKLNKQEWIELAKKELQRFYPEIENKTILHAQIVKETEATFANQPGANAVRPNQKTIYPGFYLAGDWTQTGLPATIESAVKSGNRAAAFFLEESGKRS